MMLEGPKEYQRENIGVDRGAAPPSVAGQPVKDFAESESDLSSLSILSADR
jgi:hypothetical protein